MNVKMNSMRYRVTLWSAICFEEIAIQKKLSSQRSILGGVDYG